MSAEDVPLSVLLAVQANTSIWILPDGCDGKGHLVKMNVGDVLIFRGDLVHAGSGYNVQHFRIHGYFLPPKSLYDGNIQDTARCGGSDRAAIRARRENARASIAKSVWTAKLQQLGYREGATSDAGDCWLLAAMAGVMLPPTASHHDPLDEKYFVSFAGHEITAKEAADPSTTTLELVAAIRARAINFLTGREASDTRSLPDTVTLPSTPSLPDPDAWRTSQWDSIAGGVAAALIRLEQWRQVGFWSHAGDDGHLSAAFQYARSNMRLPLCSDAPSLSCSSMARRSETP
jgi:hypothetical protein